MKTGTEIKWLTPEEIESIAIVCHEANKTWCHENYDHDQLPWYDAPEWQRQSAIAQVKFRLENPDSGEDAQHNSWMKEKVDAGWKYGMFKNAGLKNTSLYCSI